MPNPSATLQTAQPSMGTVSRMPQTTGQPAAQGSAPFTRLSRKGQILGPSQAGFAYGSLWTPILKPVGGYMRALNLYVSATAGTLSGASAQPDAPYSAIQNLFLRDPFGQPILQADGYSLFLINLYGGQVGMDNTGNNPAVMPSFVNGITATTGTFTFRLQLPLELDSSGYCSLPSMNAASQPQLQLQLNPAASVYAGTITVAPTLTLTADEPYWMAPVDTPQIAPPDVGSSAQWSTARAAAGIASAQFQRIVLPRVGTFIHTLILVLRDSTGARIDAWPQGDLGLWIDGVPVLYESFAECQDRMFTAFGVTRPTGVIAYTFRDSVQSLVSTADTYDLLAPTTPATLLEIVGTFGTITNAPATITAITGELFPVGGIPYTHLSA